MSDVEPAATLVVVRDGDEGLEVLMLRRSSQVKFAPGHWVFPGGRVDAGDHAGRVGDHLAAAQRAAVRETFEEAGLQVAPETLQYFSHWTTPSLSPKRYATWFFLADVSVDAVVQIDNGEIDHFSWLTPRQALARFGQGELPLMPPTYVTLSELADCADVAAARQLLHGRPLAEYLPRVVTAGKDLVFLYNGDVGYDAGDHMLVGVRNRLWMTADGWRYERS